MSTYSYVVYVDVVAETEEEAKVLAEKKLDDEDYYLDLQEVLDEEE